jgi:hypothetical protein
MATKGATQVRKGKIYTLVNLTGLRFLWQAEPDQDGASEPMASEACIRRKWKWNRRKQRHLRHRRAKTPADLAWGELS